MVYVDDPMSVVTTLRFRVSLPPRELSPNGQGAGSRFLMKQAKALYWEEVRLMAISEINRTAWTRPAKVRVSLLWGMGGKGRPRVKGINPWYRPKDPDNAVSAWKAGFDGLKAAGAIVDDSWEHMELGTVRAVSDDGPWVEVTVEAI